MSRNRKPRSDQGPLQTLTPDQRETLLGWLRENKSYSEVHRLLRDELGITISPTSVGTFYRNNMEAILGPKPQPLAAGVSVTINFLRPREVRLAIHPLAAKEDATEVPNATTLQAGGVEVVAVSKHDGEIKLAVFPMAEPAT